MCLNNVCRQIKQSTAAKDFKEKKLMGHRLGKNRFAYVFYATDNKYAVAVCVAVKLLKQISIRDDVDFVVLHLPVTKYILNTMHKMDIITKKVDALPYLNNGYFKDSLIKLRIFQLIQYDRIVFLDSDTIPLKSLDHLFSLPFNEMIASPRAYWLRQPFVTSLLLVVKPSLMMWNRVRRHFETAFEKKYYDMDIINLEFKEEIHYLSDEYGCLNSEWEDKDFTYHFGNPENSHEKIRVVHFTALGKPWLYHPDKVCYLRPNAHPKFRILWEKWWSTRDQIIKESPLISRIKFSFHKYTSQKDKLKWVRYLRTRIFKSSHRRTMSIGIKNDR